MLPGFWQNDKHVSISAAKQQHYWTIFRVYCGVGVLVHVQDSNNKKNLSPFLYNNKCLVADPTQKMFILKFSLLVKLQSDQ